MLSWLPLLNLLKFVSSFLFWCDIFDTGSYSYGGLGSADGYGGGGGGLVLLLYLLF